MVDEGRSSRMTLLWYQWCGFHHMHYHRRCETHVQWICRWRFNCLSLLFAMTTRARSLEWWCKASCFNMTCPTCQFPKVYVDWNAFVMIHLYCFSCKSMSHLATCNVCQSMTYQNKLQTIWVSCFMSLVNAAANNDFGTKCVIRSGLEAFIGRQTVVFVLSVQTFQIL